MRKRYGKCLLFHFDLPGGEGSCKYKSANISVSFLYLSLFFQASCLCMTARNSVISGEYLVSCLDGVGRVSQGRLKVSSGNARPCERDAQGRSGKWMSAAWMDYALLSGFVASQSIIYHIWTAWCFLRSGTKSTRRPMRRRYCAWRMGEFPGRFLRF